MSAASAFGPPSGAVQAWSREHSTAGSRQAILEWGTLAGAALFIALCNLGGYRPLNTHEVLVAQTAREMYESGNYIVPTYFGVPRFQKPPLAYWCAMTSYSIFGRSDWTARLPFALAGVALVLVAAMVGARLDGRRSGLSAGFALMTTLYWLKQTLLAEADILLALSVAVAMAIYADAVVSSNQAPSSKNVRSNLFWVALAISMLAKGPVGVLFVFAAISMHALAERGRIPWSILVAPLGWFLFGLLSAVWPVAVLAATNVDPANPSAVQVWSNETLGRFARDPNGVARHAFYYPYAALWQTLPWTPLWIAGVVQMFRNPTRSVDRLLICWLVAPMLVLSLSAGKQEHYLVPALLPCSIWTGRMLGDITDRWRSWRRAAVGIVVVIASIEMIVLPLKYGRRVTAEWVKAAFSPVDSSMPIIALGHSVQWLSFYAEPPMIRVDSLEEFFACHAGRKAWVLTTQVNVPAIGSRCRIVQNIPGPKDHGLSKSRLPVLLQVEPASN